MALLLSGGQKADEVMIVAYLDQIHGCGRLVANALICASLLAPSTNTNSSGSTVAPLMVAVSAASAGLAGTAHGERGDCQ